MWFYLNAYHQKKLLRYFLIHSLLNFPDSDCSDTFHQHKVPVPSHVGYRHSKEFPENPVRTVEIP